MSDYVTKEEHWKTCASPATSPPPPSDFKPEEGEDAGFKEVGANGA